MRWHRQLKSRWHVYPIQSILWLLGVARSHNVNSYPPGQNGRHFPDDIFKCIFMKEKFCILTWISLKFVPKSPINNIPALVQIMVWCRPGDKPLSEPMMVNLLDAYMHHSASVSQRMEANTKWPPFRWWYFQMYLIEWKSAWFDSYFTEICSHGSHDDVIKWKHFPHNWPFVRGIHRSPVNSPHKGQWCEALIFLWSASE